MATLRRTTPTRGATFEVGRARAAARARLARLLLALNGTPRGTLPDQVGRFHEEHGDAREGNRVFYDGMHIHPGFDERAGRGP